MTESNGEVVWYKPFQRALFGIDGLRISRSLARSMRTENYLVTFDTDFEGVMRNCLRPKENWISEGFIRAYGDAHREGWAHSCEVWVNGDLVGGIYGLGLGTVFSAESMFHRHTDMGKIALHEMILKCASLGFELFDAQVLNPHLESLGAYEVSEKSFGQLLAQAVNKQTDWSRSLT